MGQQGVPPGARDPGWGAQLCRWPQSASSCRNATHEPCALLAEQAPNNHGGWLVPSALNIQLAQGVLLPSFIQAKHSPEHRGGWPQEESRVSLGLLKSAHPVLVREVLCGRDDVSVDLLLPCYSCPRGTLRQADGRGESSRAIHTARTQCLLAPRAYGRPMNHLPRAFALQRHARRPRTAATPAKPARPAAASSALHRTCHACQGCCLSALKGSGASRRVANV